MSSSTSSHGAGGANTLITLAPRRRRRRARAGPPDPAPPDPGRPRARRLRPRPPRRRGQRRGPAAPRSASPPGVREGGLLEQLLFSVTVEAMPGNIPNVARRRRVGASARRPAPRRRPPGARPASPLQHEADELVVQVAHPRVGMARRGRRGRRRRGRGPARAARRRPPTRRPRTRATPARGDPCCGVSAAAPPADLLVVGLGNPGDEYARTRHNVGAEVVELLAKRHGAKLRKGKERALADEVTHRGARGRARDPAHLHERLRRGGRACSRAATASSRSRSWSCTTSSTCPSATLKLKAGGGLAGHNGLRSIKAHLHSDEFLRVRIGVEQAGRRKERGADHVLNKFGKRERTEIDVDHRAGGRRGRGDRPRRRRRRDEPLQRPLIRHC